MDSVRPRRKIFNSMEEKQNFVHEYKKKLKTELCKNWQLKGSCKFEDKCSFAHGMHELKDKIHLHSNYKTKKCKQFHTQGHCFYGYRCQYRHLEACDQKKLQLRFQNIKKLLAEIIESSDTITSERRFSNSTTSSESLLPSSLSDSEFSKEPAQRLPIFVELTSSESIRVGLFQVK
eukprot:TRINITY_DN1921_c0_g1_i3.p1 TRINITY_DN1921_c0_g1~~TRINITY_DN1921_c0_g1_i3.p1  ORF type:complete len:176 (-),score=10.04 TRINITY_DN1921_c0_g1_i3:53-580(-)